MERNLTHGTRLATRWGVRAFARLASSDWAWRRPWKTKQHRRWPGSGRNRNRVGDACWRWGCSASGLAKHGIEPILVGGAALEFYTAGGYATADVDLAMTTSEEVHEVFAALGFEREGRYWHHAELDLLFEAPAPAGLPGEDAPRTENGCGWPAG